jgi:hypothetical protein
VCAKSIRPSPHLALEHVHDELSVSRRRVPGAIRVDLAGVPAAAVQLRRAQSESREVQPERPAAS